MAPSSPPSDQQQVVLACAYPHCTAVREWNSSSEVNVINCGCYAPVCDSCMEQLSCVKGYLQGRYSCPKCTGGWDFQGSQRLIWSRALKLHETSYQEQLENEARVSSLEERIKDLKMAQFLLASAKDKRMGDAPLILTSIESTKLSIIFEILTSMINQFTPVSNTRKKIEELKRIADIEEAKLESLVDADWENPIVKLKHATIVAQKQISASESEKQKAELKGSNQVLRLRIMRPIPIQNQKIQELTDAIEQETQKLLLMAAEDWNDPLTILRRSGPGWHY
ncbi:hypothetical protein BKA70DRAFT_1429120 [Coprinopsis sp. MPI-PUGE-AT-0042]|nr:hypothetical protein BKA70DRAFT_1429120 [Coprinopsis sp. MPI-PUGE-AT-0042]